MSSREDAHSWRDELLVLSRAILEELAVPHTERHLSDIVELEESYTFHARQRPPAFSPTPYDRKVEDPELQLEALGHVLRAFGVRLELFACEFEFLESADAPCIVLLAGKSRAAPPELLLLRSFDPSGPTLCDSHGRYRELPTAEIRRRWSGAIGVLRRFSDSAEEELETHRHRDRLSRSYDLVLVSALAGILVVASAALSPAGSLPLLATLAASKTLGLLVARRLRDIEATGRYGDPMLERFCRVREGFDCRRLLSLPGAKFLGVVSWADVGLWYFSGTLAVLGLAGLVAPYTDSLLGIIAASSLAVLPYTVYSVLHQRFVAHTWCILCLVVQGLLWLEAGLSLALFRAGSLAPPTDEALALAALVLLLAASWVRDRSRRMGAEAEARIERLRVLKLWRDPATLVAGLENGVRIDVTPLPGELTFGRGDEALRILAVLDPECRFCARAYEWLRNFRVRTEGRVSLHVRVMSETTELTTCEDLLALSLAGRADEAKALLEAWYRRVVELRRTGRILDNGLLDAEHYERWKEEVGFPEVQRDGEFRAAIAAHRRWQRGVLFEKWPELFVNGHHWPASHPRESLDYHLDDLEAWTAGDGRAG